MTYDDLIKVYGSQAGIARAFGLSRASVNRWAKTGKVPALRALQFKHEHSPQEARMSRKALQAEAAKRWVERG